MVAEIIRPEVEASVAPYVERARAGDQQALVELIQMYERPIYNFLLGLTRNPQDAEDLAQDVWLKVSAQLGQLRDADRFVAWLYRTARNSHLDLIKSRQRRPQQTLEEDGREMDLPDAEDAGPEEQLLSQDDRRKVWEALGRLSERYRTALFLREFEGLSYADIGETLGVSRGTAEVLLFRAREGLRRQFMKVDEAQPACTIIPLQLSSLIDNEIAPDRRADIERHVQGCGCCNDRLVTMTTGRSLYRGLGLVAAPNSLLAAILAKIGIVFGSSGALTTLGAGSILGGGAAGATVAATTAAGGGAGALVGLGAAVGGAGTAAEVTIGGALVSKLAVAVISLAAFSAAAVGQEAIPASPPSESIDVATARTAAHLTNEGGRRQAEHAGPAGGPAGGQAPPAPSASRFASIPEMNPFDQPLPPALTTEQTTADPARDAKGNDRTPKDGPAPETANGGQNSGGAPAAAVRALPAQAPPQVPVIAQHPGGPSAAAGHVPPAPAPQAEVKAPDHDHDDKGSPSKSGQPAASKTLPGAAAKASRDEDAENEKGNARTIQALSKFGNDKNDKNSQNDQANAHSHEAQPNAGGDQAGQTITQLRDFLANGDSQTIARLRDAIANADSQTTARLRDALANADTQTIVRLRDALANAPKTDSKQTPSTSGSQGSEKGSNNGNGSSAQKSASPGGAPAHGRSIGRWR